MHYPSASRKVITAISIVLAASAAGTLEATEWHAWLGAQSPFLFSSTMHRH